ncbi:unnamed protein product [Cyprideis torosa]|uniref:Uncharacterized protein n=1 Tax=Cyprideis torosa TaxID=163714 RepID=A0A7R8W5U4_9CRUS|nr:unnamed protein product [Cyprideis torosa]CAG0885677.1 unnamed protein product [Cyprideis torosa]
MGGPPLRKEKRRNPRKTDWDKYREELHRRLRGGAEGDLETAQGIEELVQALTEAILKSFEAACPLRPVGVTSRPKWPTEIKELQLRARRAQRRAFRTKTEEDWGVKVEAQRQFKRALRKFERDTWRKYCGEMEGMTPTARLVKVLKQDNRVQMGMLKKRDGSFTGTPEEALDLLLQDHFPAEEGGVVEEQVERALADEASIEEAKMYTDGSRMGNKTGMGFLIQVPGEEDVEVSVPLGETPTVYQAEVSILMMNSREADNEREMKNSGDDDPVEKMLTKAGCLNQHYAIQECMAEYKDWRKCQKEVAAFRDCINSSQEKGENVRYVQKNRD